MTATGGIALVRQAVVRNRLLEHLLEAEELDLWNDGYARALHDIETAQASADPDAAFAAVAAHFDRCSTELVDDFLTLGQPLPLAAVDVAAELLEATTTLTVSERETARVLLAEWTDTLARLAATARAL